MPRITSAKVTADTSVVTTNETAVAQVDNVITGGPGRTVELHGSMQITTGAATTAVTPRIRRGAGVGGALVGEGNPIGAGAAATVAISLDTEDLPGDVDHQSYTLTVQQTAATGNGTVLQAELIAEVAE